MLPEAYVKAVMGKGRVCWRNAAQLENRGGRRGPSYEGASACGSLAALSRQAKAGLPADALSFTLTLLTDQYADDRTAGKQSRYTFSGINAAAVPMPVPDLGSMAMSLAGRGAAGLLARQRVRQAGVNA